jgi:glycosyltransferase involved in cell wall biosynthesis
MYKALKIGVVVPAYNEQALISKTISSIPEYVDIVIAINDASKDGTLTELNKLKEKQKNLIVLDNEINGGVGFSIKRGLKQALEKDVDLVAIMAGDAQMDPQYLKPMIDNMLERKLDFIKANRFLHLEALKDMPLYRRVGNVAITILTKFATGYYSIFDSQNGYVVYSKKSIELLSFNLLSDRYDYENTVLIGMSIAGLKIGDYPIPALYGEEKSTINVLPTALKTIHTLHKGFWRRIYYKYILYNFHPIALFLLTGVPLVIFGFLVGIYVIYDRIFNTITPTSGTVMLAVLPIILGIQLLLTALILDVLQEDKN